MLKLGDKSFTGAPVLAPAAVPALQAREIGAQPGHDLGHGGKTSLGPVEPSLNVKSVTCPVSSSPASSSAVDGLGTSRPERFPAARANPLSVDGDDVGFSGAGLLELGHEGLGDGIRRT
jgi:hypothetical protein